MEWQHKIPKDVVLNVLHFLRRHDMFISYRCWQLNPDAVLDWIDDPIKAEAEAYGISVAALEAMNLNEPIRCGAKLKSGKSCANVVNNGYGMVEEYGHDYDYGKRCHLHRKGEK